MILRAAATDPHLEEITQALVECVKPARIILFGSRARGDARPDSDYDIVVEMDFDDFHACRGDLYGAVREVRDARDVQIDILLRRPGQIEERRDDPGYMDWEIARDGVVIYPAGSSDESLRPTRERPGKVRESHEPLESIGDWLARAHEDLRVIDRYSRGWQRSRVERRCVSRSATRREVPEGSLHPTLCPTATDPRLGGADSRATPAWL